MTIATILDPRCKHDFFNVPKSRVKALLQQVSDLHSTVDIPTSTQEENPEELSVKCPCTLWKTVSDIHV